MLAFRSDVPCRRGHVPVFRTPHGHCADCRQAGAKINYQKNKKEIRGKQDQRRALRPELAAKNWNDYYARNFNFVLAGNKEWGRRNPAKRAANLAHYTASRLNATPSWLTEEQRTEIENFYIRGRAISEVTSAQHHIDHVIPLRGKTVCGLHVPWNLQILERRANLRKSNRLSNQESAR